MSAIVESLRKEASMRFTFIVTFVVTFVLALAFLVFMDVITDHEMPTIPDCEEDEVLDVVIYDTDYDERVYECVHPDSL